MPVMFNSILDDAVLSYPFQFQTGRMPKEE
jgi:hypothetical protein